MKARYFFPGLAVLLVGAFYLNSLQVAEVAPPNGSNYEREILNEQGEPIAPEDAWMYEVIAPSEDIDPDSIYAFECELRTKRPEALTTVCADFGMALWDIKWGKWDAFGGYGEGTYSENDCEPSCVEGTISKRPATVFLTDLTYDGVRYYFNTAKIRLKGVKYSSNQYEFVWDIASFYREVPDMRSENIYED